MIRCEVVHLGRMPYGEAYARQTAALERVLASRDAADPLTGVILTVEHDPVITVSRRAGAGQHILAGAATLQTMGIAVEETDRGGDITYHGPGQLVVYPVLDLNALNLGLHAYMRMLESAVIDTCAQWGIPAQRDASATGVWVPTDVATGRVRTDADATLAKICAMGVRVRRWISMHGLAINVATDLRHFATIVPCGLHGRPVCSMQSLLGEASPTLTQVRDTLTATLHGHLDEQLTRATQERAARGGQ